MKSVRVQKKNQSPATSKGRGGKPEPDDHHTWLEKMAAEKRRMAIADMDPFQHFAEHLFGNTGAEIGQACIKQKNRIVAKAEGEYNGDINQVGDVLRMKITCDSVEQIQSIRAILWRQQELALARGATPEKMKEGDTPLIATVGDYFAQPINHGYRAINVKVAMPDGLRAEMQITHRGLEDAYDYTHKPYEAMRRITHEVDTQQGGVFNDEQARRYGKMVSVIAQTYDAVSAEHGLDRLLSPKGQEKVAKRKAWMKQFAQDNRTSEADKMLPPWKNKPESRQESLSARLIKLGFEIEEKGPETPAPTADAYAELATRAQAQFEALPIDEQLAIRGLLTRKPNSGTNQIVTPDAPVLKK